MAETAAVAAEAGEANVESVLDDAASAPAADGAAQVDAKPESEAGAKPADDAKPGEEPVASLLDDDDNGENPKPDGPAAEAKGVNPEAYQSFTLPDGMAMDEDALAKATPFFQKHKLSQEDAQELVTLYAELAKSTVTTVQAETAQAHRALVNEWSAQTKAHPEFGGAKLAESRGLVKQAISKFGGSPKEQAELTLMLGTKEGGWGLGNNPLIFALLARAAAATSPDTMVTGDASHRMQPKTPAQVLYPNMPGDN